ncbi:MAG: hypothetical protein M0R76_02670 [Proteobacteria bacterium]|nr:hypothetical protein [Pseudomonadota bacterium]
MRITMNQRQGTLLALTSLLLPLSASAEHLCAYGNVRLNAGASMSFVEGVYNFRSFVVEVSTRAMFSEKLWRIMAPLRA